MYDYCDAKDEQGTWYEAKIVATRRILKSEELGVLFRGFKSLPTSWMSRKSKNIAIPYSVVRPLCVKTVACVCACVPFFCGCACQNWGLSHVVPYHAMPSPHLTCRSHPLLCAVHRLSPRPRGGLVV